MQEKKKKADLTALGNQGISFIIIFDDVLLGKAKSHTDSVMF